MAATPSDEQLKQIIAETLSVYNNKRTEAEKLLKAASQARGHASAVLRLVASSDGIDPSVRQAAAVHFKNTVKKGWTKEEAEESKIFIDDGERQTIKTHLVQLMCTTPPLIQAQLSESISLIAKTDYPDHWDNLLPELVRQFNSPDSAVVNGVLMTANSIFKSFCHVERSDALYRVILYTLQGVQAPLLALLKQTSQIVFAHANDANQLKPKFETLKLIYQIVYSLVYQDLPEYFEDNMHEWMGEFEKYLQPNLFPALVDADEDMEPSPLDKAQAAIIEILDHFAIKDEEIFIEKFLDKFTGLVWNLLITVTSKPKQDILATSSIRFLTGLISKRMHRRLFQDEATLRQIVLQIVIPNLYFREADEERFEDDPSEYMVTEVEGSDSESRRRCSQDCLKAMCRNFEPTTNICVQHIQSMLAESTTQWKAKDAAIHLMMGIAIRLESSRGVSELNPAVNLLDFFQTQVLPELRDSNHSNRPVVKATSIKFVCTFRNQFTVQQLSELFPLLIAHLQSPIVVVHTFAAYTIERILSVRDDKRQPKFGSAQLQPFLESLFNGLFAIIDNQDLNENGYVMKCVTRCLATAGQAIVPVTQIVISKLTAALGRAAKNPREPQYNHYLFESIAVLIRNVCSQNPAATASFEPLLFEPFNIVLQMNVEEFTPYVFQVLAQLLEYRPKESGLGDSYKQLFAPLMTADLWEKAKVPALSRLLQAYLRQSAPELVQHVLPILGIFQRLMAATNTEEHGFVILNAAITYLPQECLVAHLQTIFRLLLTRLQSHRTQKYSGLLTNFFSVFIAKNTPDGFIRVANELQAGMAVMLVKDVWAPYLINSPPVQRTKLKTHVVGLTRLLLESPTLFTQPGGNVAWGVATVAVIKLITSPNFKAQDESAAAGAAIEVVDLSYDAQFSQLSFARRPVEDPYADVTADPYQTFCEGLMQVSAKHPGQLGPILAQAAGSDPKLQTGLQTILQKVSLA